MSIDYAKMDADKFFRLFNKFNSYNCVRPDQMQLLTDVDFSSMKHRKLTCVRHPWERFTTKNPFERSIFFLQGIHGLMAAIDEQCDCPFTDLRVVIGEGE